MKDQCFFSALNQITGDNVPAQRSAAGYDEWLRCGVGGLEEFAEEGQAFAECFDKGRADVALSVAD